MVAAEAQGSADDMVARGAQAGMSDEDIATQQAEIIAAAQVQARNNLENKLHPSRSCSCREHRSE